MKTNFNNLALAVLRVSFSGILLTHGIPKISMLFENPGAFPDPIGIGSTVTLILAILTEVVAPILIIIGFKTKIAAITVVATMAAAAFVVHAQDSFGVKEKALLFMFGFIVIALAGAGKYSVDRK